MAWNLPRNPASLPSVIGSYSAKPNYTSPPGESPPSLSLRRGSVSSRRDSVSSSATDDAKSTMSRRERAQTRRDSLVSVASSTGSVAFFDDDTPPSEPLILDSYHCPDVPSADEDIDDIFDVLPFPCEWIIDFTDVPAFRHDHEFYGLFRSETGCVLAKAMIQYVVHAVVQENSFDLTSKNLFMIASRCYVVLFSKVQNSWDKIRFAGFYAQALAQAIYLALLFSFPYEHKTLTRPEFLQNLMDTVCLSVSGMLGPRPMQNLWNSVGKRMLSRIQRWKIKHQILKWPLPSFAPSLELDAIHTPLPGLHPHEMSHRAPEPADKRTYINCRLNHSRFVQTYLMHTRRYKKSVKDWSLENFMFDRMVATKAADPPEPSVFSRASTETDSFEFAGDELRANNRLGYKRDVSQVFKSSGCAHYDGLSSENISLDPKNPLSYHLHSIHSALPRVKGAAPGKTPFRRDRCKPLGPHDSPYPWVVSKLRMRSSGRNLFSGFRDTQHEKKSMKAEPLHSSSPLLNTEEFYQDPLLATNHRKATAESLRKKSLSQKINRQNINEATMPSNSRRKDSVSSSVKSVFLTEFDSFLQQQGSYYDIHEKTAKERVEEMEKTGEITLLNMDDIDEERSDYFYLNAALKPPTNSHFHDRRRLLTSIHRGLQNTREEMEKNKKASRRRVRQGGIKISAEIDKIAQAKKVAMNSAKSVKENIAFVMFKRKQEEKDQAEQLSRVQKSLNDHRLW